MHRIDLVEITGSLLILVAYVAGRTGHLRWDSRTALSLNLLGSAALAAIAFTQESWGFLLLEGSWALVSAFSLAAACLRTPAPTDRPDP
ncbi:hypothetical protein ACFYYR_14740 [Streptomyces sp. NPDC001922]|uniref:CBU_0592 family membrane protein n=1 Tax=Streptomyces sp. NPDC001922 TaxID=3364624 RepID=UPI0036AB9AF7